MSFSLDEKRKSISNNNSDVLDAVVVENFGDPGLDEDQNFDILSRFLIVAIESPYRVPTTQKWNSILAIVARPRSLWVDAEGGLASSYSSQKRSDPLGNLSIGVAGSFTTNGIPRIDKPYRIGESIKIKKLPVPYKFWDNNSIFNSAFSLLPDQYFLYNSWHNTVASFPYFIGNQARIDGVASQCIFNPDNTNFPSWYGMTLYKYQYEAFMLTLAQGRTDMTTYMEGMFGNVMANTSAVYLANGGYVFKEQQYVNFYSVDYEDINVGNKSRVSTSDCMPLIISTPNSFPTPRSRLVGTISYNPTYSTIVKSN